jgi:hypothetical protein
MVILICDILDNSTEDLALVHGTKTLYNLIPVSDRSAKDTVATVLRFGAGVVVPDDAAKHTPAVKLVMHVLQLLGVSVQTTREYLRSLETSPAAAHAASPAKHVAAAGQSPDHHAAPLAR